MKENESVINYKKVYALLSNYEYHESVKIYNYFICNQKITNRGNKGTSLLTRTLYFRMLNVMLNRANSQYRNIFILPPKGSIYLNDVIKNWLCNDNGFGSMNSKDLLNYGKPSTFSVAYRILLKSGLINNDNKNKLYLLYPYKNNLYGIIDAYFKILKDIKENINKKQLIDDNDKIIFFEQ